MHMKRSMSSFDHLYFARNHPYLTYQWLLQCHFPAPSEYQKRQAGKEQELK